MVSISNEELARVKTLALQAVLNNQPLPGSEKPVVFPDLPFIISQQANLYVLDEHMKKNINIESTNTPVQHVSQADLKNTADKLKKVIYFQFETESSEKDSVLLSLIAKVLTAAPDSRTQNLSSMQLKFQKVENDWKIVDPPSYMSS